MKIAAFTMAFNEADILPIWREHYGRLVGHDNLYVIDHGSTDGSVADISPTHVFPLPRSPLDEEERVRIVGEVQRQLLQSHDVVIHADCDELILPDPRKYAGIAEFLRANPEPVLSAVGLNVMHDPAREAAYDPHLPWWRQRRLVAFDGAYCKPLVTRAPVHWTPGFHCASETERCKADLFLFHLRALDVGMARARFAQRQQLEFSEDTLAKNYSQHFRAPWEKYAAGIFPYSPEVLAAAPERTDFSEFLSRVEGKKAARFSVKAGPFRLPESFWQND